MHETRINIGLCRRDGLKGGNGSDGHYREPTKEEWAEAAKDPAEWDRLVVAAERAAIAAEG
ncbi:hypothetical protein BH18ACI4_BH18ACI4_25860 [soil metagenome]